MLYQDRVQKIKSWVSHNERLVTSGAFLGGFGIDLLTLNRIDQWFDNAILLTHLTLACIAILVINTDIEERFNSNTINRLSPLMLYVAQFAFGGLLSGFVIFYTKAASWYVAWPFLIALYVLFLANDRLLPYYRRLEVQTAMLFGALFSLTIFFVPTMLGLVGDGIFLLSGIISVAFITGFLSLLYWLLPSIGPPRRWRVRRNIFIIFTLFNILYFTHVIPPIPLSLKHGEIYHSVVRSGPNQYNVSQEKIPWYDLKRKFIHKEFHVYSQNDRVFAFTSIFGPNNLTAPVYHKWQWFNPKSEQWKDVITADYNLTGGRDGGFRWYSYVTNPTPGDWRVRITTKHDREIGRIIFTVIPVKHPPTLEETSI